MTESLEAILARVRPEGPALIVPEDGQAVTFGQLAERIEALAGSLAASGVRRADRVAFALPNGPEVIQLLLAITALGAAAAPLNPGYTHAEFGFYLGDIAPRFVVVPDSGIAAAQSAAAEASLPVLAFRAVPNAPPDLLAAGEPVRPAAIAERGGADDVAVVLHTSGTTSRPKQVPLRQRNLMASTRTIAAHYQLGAADVSFCMMPLFLVHGLLASAFAALSAGGSVIVPRRFTPRAFWPQAREHGTTWFSAGPTLHQMLLERAAGDGSIPTLRFARSCSSALSPALLERTERVYGVPVLEAYGMTEASHQMASNPLPPGARKPASVGVPTGTQIAIAAKDGTMLADGTAGEVRDGYLYLEGRIKEMIIRGGENISPAEIEQVLLSHPAVRDAVCFAVPDEKYGEVVGAAVTLSGDATERTLIDYCRERVAAFKVPAVIYLVPDIPRTTTGKIQRRRVAESVTGRASP
jgi:acyl-CoA synthetase (AMP-forming)/AMP-acid ligase II